jgi:hypothetical protein
MILYSHHVFIYRDSISENCYSDLQNTPSLCELSAELGPQLSLRSRRHGPVCATLRDEHVLYQSTRLGPAAVVLGLINGSVVVSSRRRPLLTSSWKSICDKVGKF